MRAKAVDCRLLAVGKNPKTIFLALLFVLFGLSIARADVVIVPDFRVDQDPTPNTLLNGGGIASSLSYSYAVITYKHWDPVNSRYRCYARRYDLNGMPLANQFRVDLAPDNLGCGFNDVAIDTNGNMIFTWGDGRTGVAHIYFKIFDQNESTLISDTMVDTGPGGARSNIASLPGGGFVIVWGDTRGVGGSIYARIYDSSGNPVAADFRVDQNPDVDSNYGLSIIPVVATSPTGRIYFVWQDMRDGFPCGAGLGHIYARIFDSVGNPIGNDFRIDQSTSSAIYPTIASTPDGNFIVAWQDYRVNGCVSVNTSIFGRAFDLTGSPAGNDFQVNTLVQAFYPSAACAPSGRCFITYGTGYVNGRHISSSGSLLDPEFRVNVVGPGAGPYPKTAAVGLYSYITAWDGPSNQVWANISGPESEAYPMLSPFGLVLLGIILLAIIVVRIRTAHKIVYYLIIIFFIMFTVHDDVMSQDLCYPGLHPENFNCECNTTDYEHLPPGAVTMSLVHGDAAKAANRFKLFFIGEGWADADQDNFNAQVEAFIESLKSNTTYAAYFDFMNFYRVNLISPESGTDVLDIPADAFYGEGADQAFIFDDENVADFSPTGEWSFMAWTVAPYLHMFNLDSELEVIP